MAVTTGAGLEGIVATSSDICYIDGEEGILSYQGFNIHTLAEHANFEEVIYLLWHGRLPSQSELDALRARLVESRGIPRRVLDFLAAATDSNPMDVLRTAVTMLSLDDPLAKDMSPEANLQKAHKLMAQTATIVTTFERLRAKAPIVEGDPSLGFAANFLYTLTGKKPDDVMEKAFDVALILHADHELNASTFAARVTAATLSDIYSAVTSGIGALKGPLHGGANEDVIRMLLEAGGEAAALEHIHYRLANKIKIPGFGHRVYKTEDPRATHLRQLSEELGQPHRPRRSLPHLQQDRANHEGHSRSSTPTWTSTPPRPTTPWASRSTSTPRSSPSAACPAGPPTCWSSTATTA